MKKRYLALLLALVCVFSVFVTAAPAAAVDGDDAPAADVAPVDDDDLNGDAEQPDDSTPADDPAQSGDAEQPDDSTPTDDPAQSGDAEQPDDPDQTEEPQESEKPVTPDKPKGPWYQKAMDYAVAAGLIKGDKKGNLNPNDNATRAEVITILMRIFQNTQSKWLGHYTDMKETAWYYKAMSTAAAMGVLNGYEDRTMRPNAPITREEAFALIARVFAVPQADASVLSRFSDAANVSNWAKKTLAGMAANGYIKGDAGGVRPKDNITRAEIAQILYNLKLTITEDPSEIPAEGIVVYQGKDPVDLAGFSGSLFLGGGCGSAPVVNGDAPDASVYVRTDPGATVTMNGSVKETHLLSDRTSLVGPGNAGAVERAGVNCTVSCANTAVSDTYDASIYGAQLYATNVQPITPENRSVTFTLNIDASKCDYSTKPDGRWARLMWTLNGNLVGNEKVWLGYTPETKQFTVSEWLWTPELAGEYNYHFMLFYGTDMLCSDVIVPIQNYSAAEYQQLQSRDYPYKIEVVRNQCTVLIWGQDKAGNYDILYRVCVCSPGQGTVLGTFRTPSKMRWQTLMGGVWGQYCTQIYQGILFHSVYYHSADPSTLYASAYNQLGTVCSHGCVRLTVADAKWIYDNCRLGTVVYVHDSSTLPVPKPTAQKIPYSGVLSGWDPTDPDPRNPWH